MLSIIFKYGEYGEYGEYEEYEEYVGGFLKRSPQTPKNF